MDTHPTANGVRMSSKEHSPISQAVFDQLLARAIELDDEGREGLDTARVRAIAQELGIAPSAWDAAVREFTQGSLASVPTPLASEPPRVFRRLV
jgi:hypothetical protein